MDRLSAAASVAGILSLGIQVTKSLVDFYSAYKSQKSDVAHTFKKSEHLLGVLEDLHNQLRDRSVDADERGLLKSVEGSLQQCEEVIQDLQSETKKFKSKSTDGIRASARTAAYRVAYPFRQSTLQKLNENIDELVSHLSLALHLLGKKGIDKVQNSIEDTKALLDLVRADQVSSTIREWLKAPDATINQNEACKKRHSNTGCGKSVLCSTAIQFAFRHRRSNPRVAIAFFFFTFNDDDKQDCSAMLRALILQLSSQLSDNHALLSKLHDRYRNAMPPDHDLLDCLHQLLQAFDDVYIILDALDENPQDKYREAMLQALVDLRAWEEHGLHLLVTSRDEPDIRDVLVDELGASQDETISLKNDAVDRDIASFISSSLKNDRRLQKWEKFHDQIEKKLTERANGMFRWVECQFIALHGCIRSKRQLDTLLASLPRSLDQTYERMLSNVRAESVEDARRVLTLLCCATRPLTTLEVIEGIAVELGDNPRFNEEGRLEDENDIYRLCPGLIHTDFDPDDKKITVRIAHFSVQEYLESQRILQQAVAAFAVRRIEAHAEMASICLTYLQGPVLPESTPEYPLALYAAENWFKHYHDGDPTLYRVEDQTIHFFQNTAGEHGKWMRIHNIDLIYGINYAEKEASPIYSLSLLGFDSVLSKLLSGNENTDDGLCSQKVSDLVNAKCGYHGNALSAASAGGHDKTVQVLLENGANINVYDDRNETPLYTASAGGHDKTVQLLLQKGADINLAERNYGTAYM